MRNAPDLRIQGTFPIFIVFVRSSGYFTFIPFHFVVYSIYTSICIVATYPFASGALRDNRKSYPFYLALTDLISTFSRFQKVQLTISNITPHPWETVTIARFILYRRIITLAGTRKIRDFVTTTTP